MSTDLAYMVIYPRGDRSQLSVAQVYTWEYDEWDIASMARFETREEAEQHMDNLATRHGLKCRPTQKLLD
jgi:hypothetical protein